MRGRKRPPWIQTQLDQGYKPYSFYVEYRHTTTTRAQPAEVSASPTAEISEAASSTAPIATAASPNPAVTQPYGHRADIDKPAPEPVHTDSATDEDDDSQPVWIRTGYLKPINDMKVDSYAMPPGVSGVETAAEHVSTIGDVITEVMDTVPDIRSVPVEVTTVSGIRSEMTDADFGTVEVSNQEDIISVKTPYQKATMASDEETFDVWTSVGFDTPTAKTLNTVTWLQATSPWTWAAVHPSTVQSTHVMYNIPPTKTQPVQTTPEKTTSARTTSTKTTPVQKTPAQTMSTRTTTVQTTIARTTPSKINTQKSLMQDPEGLSESVSDNHGENMNESKKNNSRASDPDVNISAVTVNVLDDVTADALREEGTGGQDSLSYIMTGEKHKSSGDYLSTSTPSQPSTVTTTTLPSTTSPPLNTSSPPTSPPSTTSPPSNTSSPSMSLPSTTTPPSTTLPPTTPPLSTTTPPPTTTPPLSTTPPSSTILPLEPTSSPLTTTATTATPPPVQKHSRKSSTKSTHRRNRNNKRTRMREQEILPSSVSMAHAYASTYRYPLYPLPNPSNPQVYLTVTPTPDHSYAKDATFSINGLSSGQVTGIAIACIIAFWIILGPLVCIVCKMRDRAKEKRREHDQEDSMSHTLIEEMIRMELARGRAKMYRTNVDDEREIERLQLQGDSCNTFSSNGTCVINPQDYVIGNRYHLEYTPVNLTTVPSVEYDKDYNLTTLPSGDYEKDYNIINQTYMDTLETKYLAKDTIL